MQVQVVEDPCAIGLLEGLHLLEEPRNEGGAAVRVAVGRVLPPRTGGVQVKRGVEIGRPAPHGGTQRLRTGVAGFDRRSVLVGEISHFVVAGWVRVDVAMCVVPQHRLVVEVVKANPPGLGAPMPADEVLDPVLDEGLVDGDAGIRRVVPGDRRAVVEHAVPAVRYPGIHVLLGAVGRDAEATGDRPAFRRPSDHRDRQQAFGARGLIALDEHVRRGSIR